MKSSTAGTMKYFEGQLTDSRCLVGFDSKVHGKLQSFQESQEALSLGNFEVKESRYGSDLEVVVQSTSDLQRSPTKFAVSESQFSCYNCEVTLSELPNIANLQRITVKVKVVCVKERETVKKALLKQDCVVADATGSCRAILWEDNVGMLEDCSYKLGGVIVHTYKGKKDYSQRRV